LACDRDPAAQLIVHTGMSGKTAEHEPDTLDHTIWAREIATRVILERLGFEGGYRSWLHRDEQLHFPECILCKSGSHARRRHRVLDAVCRHSASRRHQWPILQSLRRRAPVPRDLGSPRTIVAPLISISLRLNSLEK
jgi:hypothetical protein